MRTRAWKTPLRSRRENIRSRNCPTKRLIYLLNSRYCEVDRLSNIAVELFGNIAPGWGRVRAICSWVNSKVTFGYQHARSTKTALDVFTERVGVCRDFQHLAVTFCRAVNIPARYVTGYLGDIGIPPTYTPMDFSAWFEVYLENRWWTVDARHNHPRIGRVLMAVGRDASDVAITTSFGIASLTHFNVVSDEVVTGSRLRIQELDGMQSDPARSATRSLKDYLLDNTYDEMFTEDGMVRPHYAEVLETFLNLPPEEIARRKRSVDLSFLTQGITFNVYGHGEGTEKIFPYDLLPRIITGAEWQHIEKGLTQRITALNLFLHDVYNEGKILNDGHVPREIVYSCRQFRREMRGLQVPRNVYITSQARICCASAAENSWCWKIISGCPAASPTC